MPASNDLVTLIRQLESVGMSHEDVTRFAYEYALEHLNGKYAPALTHLIPASVRLRAASDMVEAFDHIELERRNDSWLWKNINRYCSEAPDRIYTAKPYLMNSATVIQLTKWHDKGWITLKVDFDGYHISIVKPEEAANVS